MVKSGTKKGTYVFSLKDAGSQKVHLAGDFTGWQPVAMKKQKGVYAVTVALPAGRHQYKFVADNNWLLDPDNQERAVSAMGTINSVIIAK
jgi:1,4-alpha-glucan branching enzyme